MSRLLHDWGYAKSTEKVGVSRHWWTRDNKCWGLGSPARHGVPLLVFTQIRVAQASDWEGCLFRGGEHVENAKPAILSTITGSWDSDIRVSLQAVLLCFLSRQGRLYDDLPKAYLRFKRPFTKWVQVIKATLERWWQIEKSWNVPRLKSRCLLAGGGICWAAKMNLQNAIKFQ